MNKLTMLPRSRQMHYLCLIATFVFVAISHSNQAKAGAEDDAPVAQALYMPMLPVSAAYALAAPRNRGRVVGRTRGLNPRLRGLLRQISNHFGTTVQVISGCRSYRHNRLVGGARRSMHLHCKAADIRVAGVSKSRVRRYTMRLRGRGGVGTYCGSSMVHVDVGPRRSWYYGCRKRRRR